MLALDGCIAVLPTPFAGREIDLRSFADHAEWLVAEGVDAVAVGGPAGEGPTLSPTELDLLIRAANEACDLRVPVLVHLVSSCTERAIAAAAAARRAGADGLIVACPPYSRPTQEGIFRHLEAIASAVALPILVEDDPGRTRVELAPDTIGRLARLPGLVGLVDSHGDPARAATVAERSDHRWIALSGTHAGAVAFALAGGRGCLSEVASLAPRICAERQSACRAGDWPAARRLEARLGPLAQALALEPAPTTLKCALARLRPGYAGGLRLPMLEATPPTADAIAAALSGLDADSETSGRLDARAA